MIIEIREVEYLAELDGVPIVARIKEHYLFGKWLYKLEELHSHNNALIQAFQRVQEPKKVNPIGFKTSNKKQSKKKKSNENKSKTDKS